MGNMIKLWLLSRGLAILGMAIILLLGNTVSNTIAGEEPNIAQEVNQLVQACQTGESLTVEQLQKVIASCDTLKGTISKGDHPQKKLFIIRLNKTRNLCLYLFQLKQSDKEEQH